MSSHWKAAADEVADGPHTTTTSSSTTTINSTHSYHN